MLDTKFSCLLRGIVGVIFGFLALMIPEQVILTFSGFFLIIIGLAIAVLLFLAITGRSDESMMWFGLSAILLVIAILSFVFADVVGFLFILILAGIAAYNGLFDITLALTHPKSKYIIIPAMVISAAALLSIFYLYIPTFPQHLAISIVGTLAFTFGLFSIGMGYFMPAGADDEEVTPKTANRTFRWPDNKKR
ncbi:MAG: hypothetical protein GX651_05390 [Methanomicrobiales archaeon]|nr:hypothetical protein [Methanomicrobiales archaeon]